MVHTARRFGLFSSRFTRISRKVTFDLNAQFPSTSFVQVFQPVRRKLHVGVRLSWHVGNFCSSMM